VFVGGALANDLFKAKGFEVGVSLVSKHAPDLTSIIKKTNLYVPVDVRIKRGEAVVDTTPEALLTNDRIVDVGPKSTGLLEELTSKSKFVLWNGPLGIYQEGFTTGSQQLAQTIAGSAARSVIGGGNTIAAVEKLGLMDKFGFVSTGGGAMLEFLATETLPGLEALKQENEG
jgi:phosphoglycerate kinase